MNIEEILKESVIKAPLALLRLTNPEHVQIVDNLLPYSTGFEIECGRRKDVVYNQQDIMSIPHIIESPSWEQEHRFRIPRGIEGILALYCICEKLPQYLELNPLSGIHYHVDLEEHRQPCCAYLKNLNQDSNWILDELDAWEYKGQYNRRSVGGWIRANDLGTFEFRCGEMSFDYQHLITRILHANDITRRIKQTVGIPFIERTTPFDPNPIINYLEKSKLTSIEHDVEALRSQLQELKKEEEEEKEPEISYEEIKEIIKRRVKDART